MTSTSRLRPYVPEFTVIIGTRRPGPIFYRSSTSLNHPLNVYGCRSVRGRSSGSLSASPFPEGLLHILPRKDKNVSILLGLSIAFIHNFDISSELPSQGFVQCWGRINFDGVCSGKTIPVEGNGGFLHSGALPAWDPYLTSG